MTLTNSDLTAIKGIVQQETTKIVRAEIRNVVNGQSAMKGEILDEIKRLDKKIDNLEVEMKQGFKDVNEKIDNLTKRVDKIGLVVARLEDDAPTIEEFEKLEKRVTNLEQRSALN